MNLKRLLKQTLLVVALLGVGTSASWADYNESFGAGNAITKDTEINGTAVKIQANSNPSGTGEYDVFNSKADKGIKLRTNVPLTLTVNDGYKVTNVTIYAYQNNDADAIMTCDSYTIDGAEATAFGTAIDIPLNVKDANTQTLATISTGDIEATSSIAFNFTNPTTDGKQKQIFAFIVVTYEGGEIYTRALSDWTADDVTKTEGTVGKWYNSTGITNNSILTGMMIDAEKGLRLAARNTTSTATLTLNRTANSIVTIDAVWNVGSASSDSNTPHNKFTYGDLTIQQNVRSNNLTTTYKINGKTTTIGTDKFAREDDMTIHLKVNSYTGAIVEFYLKNGETTVAQFSDLTEANNTFAAGSDYDAIILTSWMSGSSAYTWCALKSITVSEEKQDVFTYTVNAVDESSNILKEISKGDVLSTANSVTVVYDAFCLKGSKLLQADRHDDNSKQYKYTFTVDNDNTVINIKYKDKGYNNIVFYNEAENIPTLTATSSGNVPVRCSGGKGGYAATDAVITTLAPGTYTVSSFAYGNSGTNLSIYAGDNLAKTFTTASSTLSVTTSEPFTIEETTDIIFKAGGNAGSSPKVLDFIFIQSANEIIGAFDCTTDYLAQTSDLVTLKPGESYHYTFVNNNGNGENAQNWVMPVYASDGTTKKIVIRNDNWDDVAWNNTGFSSNFNWDTFVSDMNGATVDMTVAYSANNVFTMSSTITTKGGKDYSYSYTSEANNVSLSGDIKIALSVSKSWLEIKDAAKTNVAVTITSAGWATLYTPYALDFSGVEGLEAYTAACENNKVTLTKVDDVPANSGVVLKGAANNYSIPVIASSTTDKGELTGSATAATAYNAYDGYNLYMLALNANSEAQFTKVTSGSIAAGKAFLKLSNSASRSLTVVVGDEATGVQELKDSSIEGLKTGDCYNLKGQRVSQPTKGLYIVNGKKVVINK